MSCGDFAHAPCGRSGSALSVRLETRVLSIMKILLSIHDDMDHDSGGPGATCRLAEALRGRGHQVEIISFAELRGPRKLKRHLFPFFVACYAQRHPECDVMDCSLG